MMTIIQSLAVSRYDACPSDYISIKLKIWRKIIIAVVQRRLIWSQQNFAHTKTALLSWYVQNFVMIRLIYEKIYT